MPTIKIRIPTMNLTHTEKGGLHVELLDVDGEKVYEQTVEHWDKGSTFIWHNDGHFLSFDAPESVVPRAILKALLAKGE